MLISMKVLLINEIESEFLIINYFKLLFNYVIFFNYYIWAQMKIQNNNHS